MKEIKGKEARTPIVKDWRVWGILSSVTLMVIGLTIGWLTETGASIFTLAVVIGMATLLSLSEG